MAHLTALDIVVLLLVGGGAILGGLRGFVTEAISLFSWVAAIFALNLLHTPATRFLSHFVGSEAGAAILAFALVFGVMFILGKIIAASIGSRVRGSALGSIDRLLGLGFGALKGLIVATLIFLLLNLFVDLSRGAAAPRPAFLTDSKSYTMLNASGRAIVDFVKARRGAKVDKSSEVSNGSST